MIYMDPAADVEAFCYAALWFLDKVYGSPWWTGRSTDFYLVNPGLRFWQNKDGLYGDLTLLRT